MSLQKSNPELASSNENVEIEKFDMKKYQELNNKCDVVITKIKNRKSKKK